MATEIFTTSTDQEIESSACCKRRKHPCPAGSAQPWYAPSLYSAPWHPWLSHRPQGLGVVGRRTLAPPGLRWDRALLGRRPISQERGSLGVQALGPLG